MRWPAGTDRIASRPVSTIAPRPESESGTRGAGNNSLARSNAGQAAPPSDGMLEKIHALMEKGVPEVCGMSPFESAMFVLSGSQTDKDAENATIATVAAQLAQSKLAAEQRLGLTVQAELSIAALAEESMRAACGSDEKCRQQLPVSPVARTEAMEPLVNRALASMDPADYAAAAQICARINTGACAKVSYEGWAGLEPRNSAPWLLIFGAAVERKDLPAQVDAVRHIGLATEYDPHLLDRAPLYLSAEVVSRKPLLQVSIGSSVIGSTAASSIPPLFGLGRYCSESAVRDPDRRASCDNLITKFVEGDKNVIAVSIARALGKRIGWDAARVQALEDEREIILGYMGELGTHDYPLSCDALEQDIAWLRESMTKGERRWARDRAEKSGKSYAEIAEGFRAAARANAARRQQ